MQKDFIPMADGKLMEWLMSFKTNSPSVAASLGLSPAEIAQVQQLCTEYIDQIKLTAVALATAKSEVTRKKSMRKTHLQPMRKLIKKMKASPNYSTSSGAGMGVLPHKSAIDWGTYQPKITARELEELIEIKFKKYGMDMMEFSGRFNGGEWQFLGTRAHSPFYYKPANHVPGTLIKCEFVGRAIIKDERVGEESQPVTVMYAPKSRTEKITI